MFAINPSSDPCDDAAVLDALCDAIDWAYGGVSMPRSRHTGRLANNVIPRLGLCEALADPIVQALMAADGTDRDRVGAMMRDVAAARLTKTSRKPTAARD